MRMAEQPLECGRFKPRQPRRLSPHWLIRLDILLSILENTQFHISGSPH
jgi:hypothetical protein